MMIFNPKLKQGQKIKVGRGYVLVRHETSYIPMFRKAPLEKSVYYQSLMDAKRATRDGVKRRLGCVLCECGRVIKGEWKEQP